METNSEYSRKRSGFQSKQSLDWTSIQAQKEGQRLVMYSSKPDTEEVPICEATRLADGGFTGDTEVITTAGPQRVAELERGDRILALNPTTKACKLKRVADIETVDPPYKCINIETRRANLTVSPNHQIPYTTSQAERPKFVSASELPGREAYRFINEWRPRAGTTLTQVDLTDLCSDYEMNVEFDCHGHTVQSVLPEGCDPVRQNSHTGYFFDPETFEEYQNELEALANSIRIHAGPNHWRRPYRFDGDDFIEFLGWFVTEGSVSWPRSSETATVSLAQQTPTHRESIEALLNRMGLQVYTDENGFSFSSKLFGGLLERLCGKGSASKHLPPFIWDCSPQQKQLMLDTLMAGDGNDEGRYYTHSDQLAQQVVRLAVEVGLKPACLRSDPWAISVLSCNDGFASSRNVSRVFVDGPLYQLAVQDFSVVMAGRDGNFQWIAVSAVV